MKQFSRAFITFLLLLLMTVTTQAAPGVQINYTVTFPEAQAHYADVEMNISGIKQNTLDLKMPVWTPGSYLIREFEKNIETLTAYTGGKEILAGKVRKNIWRLNTAGLNAVTIKYRVYAFEISVRTSFIDAAHAFLSTTGLFIYPDGMLHQPSTIHIIPYKGWDKVSTSLERVNNDPFMLRAPDYDILFDSPIEVGNQDVFEFEATGVHYEVAMVGGGNYDKERLKKAMAMVVEKETAIYGENPNKHYVFIVHNYTKGSGGLEHLSSTTLGVSRDAWNSEGGYQRFLSLVAHEHFHLWNVKRLRPIALGPFDYDNENYTTDLWIAEGFTAYYDNLIVHRTGLYPVDNYLGILAGNFTMLDNSPGAKVQPLSQASYDAWIKAYRPDENSGNSTISYYTKGAVMAALLDLEIINDSKGAHSLDEVMRYMYQEYYHNKKRGYTDAEFKQALERFAGRNLDDFYRNYINGLTPVDYNHYLNYAGYQVVNDYAGRNEPALGVTFVKLPNGKPIPIVATVQRGSAAWIDGINVNDELVAMDGQMINDVATLLNGKHTGDKIIIGLVRDGQPLTLTVTLLKNPDVKYRIESLPQPSAAQQTVRSKWLK